MSPSQQDLDNWNKLALLVAVQADKPSSQREEIKIFQQSLVGENSSSGMTNSEWNSLALSMPRD